MHLPPIRAATTARHLLPAYRSAQQAAPRQPGAWRPPLPPAHQVVTSAYPGSAYPGVYAYQPSNAYRGYYAYPTGYPYPGYYAYQPGYAYPAYDAYRNGYAYSAPYPQYGRYRAY
jgi:hypothetical protein